MCMIRELKTGWRHLVIILDNHINCGLQLKNAMIFAQLSISSKYCDVCSYFYIPRIYYIYIILYMIYYNTWYIFCFSIYVFKTFL